MAGTDHSLTAWRKSTYSGSGGSNCVEVGAAGATVLVRDTKDRDGAVINVEDGVWQRFTSFLKTSA